MSKKAKLLEAMRRNPVNDWMISDVQTLCRQIGVHCDTPTSGDHYKVWSSLLPDVVTLPAHRPIKEPYIRRLVKFADLHLRATNLRGTRT